MKKVLVYSVCMLMVLSVAAKAPDAKLVKLFNETFPSAQNVKWFEDEKGSAVSFNQNGNFEKVMYNKDGEFVCSWKYSKYEMPINVMLSIKKNYADAEINGVTEFTSGKDVVYEIKLTKNSKLYSVTALPDGTIAKERKYKTA